MNPTIQPPRLLALRALLTALFAGSALAAAAQSVPRPPPPSTAQDELITLSPFSVSTDRDNGFVAASSLAGGRLATDLKDTPVAYSVLTRDFIDALGITNQFDASDWAPNSVKSIAGNGGGYGDDVSNAPGTYNVRGAGGGRAQRNFFIFFSPNDSYVVERFDFGRGPNAILFGNGGLGGVSTVTTKQARFGNNFTEIAQTFGSWNNSRTTLDVNRALNDRLAVRTAAVYTDADGWRDKQFEKIRAAFLTASFKLTRNTTLRAEGEYGESKRNQTFTNLTDQLSGWNGKTVFSGRADDLNNLTNAQNLPLDAAGRPITNANLLGITRRGVGYQRLQSLLRRRGRDELPERSHHARRRRQRPNAPRRLRARLAPVLRQRRRQSPLRLQSPRQPLRQRHRRLRVSSALEEPSVWPPTRPSFRSASKTSSSPPTTASAISTFRWPPTSTAPTNASTTSMCAIPT
jgi:hypothetical protein